MSATTFFHTVLVVHDPSPVVTCNHSSVHPNYFVTILDIPPSASSLEESSLFAAKLTAISVGFDPSVKCPTPAPSIFQPHAPS